MALTTSQIDKLEQLDQCITKVKQEAKQQCRKIHAGRIPWTPGLTIAIYKTMYWQGIKKQISGRTISGEVLRKRAKLGAETFSTAHLMMPKEEVIQKLCQATQDFDTVKKASERRDTWLGQMIAAQAENQNIPKKRLWQCIRQTEHSRQMSQHIKNMLGCTIKHLGLTQVTAPNDQATNRQCYGMPPNIVVSPCNGIMISTPSTSQCQVILSMPSSTSTIPILHDLNMPHMPGSAPHMALKSNTPLNLTTQPH